MRRVVAAMLVAVGSTSGWTTIARADDGGAVVVNPDNVAALAGIDEFFAGDPPSNPPCQGDYETPVADHYPVDPFDLKASAEGSLGTSVETGKAPFVKREYAGTTYYAGLSWVWCYWTKDSDGDGTADPPADPPWNGEIRYLGAYWYPIRPEPRALIPPLFDAVEKTIGKPVLSWPNMNKENDWLFVVLPMAYQLDPIGSVRAEAEVENELDRASAWIEATPTRIDVESAGYSSSCLVGDAMEDHGTDEDPPCAVIWERVGRDVPLTVTLTWTITSSVPGADIPETVQTVTDTTINVSEIQALVEQ